MNTIDRDENGINTDLHDRLKKRKKRNAENADNCSATRKIRRDIEERNKQFELSHTPLAKFLSRSYNPSQLVLFFLAFFCGEGFFQLLFNSTEFSLFKIAFLIGFFVMYKDPDDLPPMASWLAEKATGIPYSITAPLGTMVTLIVGFWAHTVFGAKNYQFTFALGAFTLFVAPFVIGAVYKFVTRVPYKLAEHKELFYCRCNVLTSWFFGGYVVKIILIDLVLGWEQGQMLHFLRLFAWLPLG